MVTSRARPRAVADGATRGAPSARSVNEHRIADGRVKGPRPWATYTCGPEIADGATHRVAIRGQPQARPIAHMLQKPPLSTVNTRCEARTGPLGDPLLSGNHAAYHDREAATRGRSHRWPHSAWRRVRRQAHSRSPARDARCHRVWPPMRWPSWPLMMVPTPTARWPPRGGHLASGSSAGRGRRGHNAQKCPDRSLPGRDCVERGHESSPLPVQGTATTPGTVSRHDLCDPYCVVQERESRPLHTRSQCDRLRHVP